MKTSTFPALRTAPATRQLAESVLTAGETLSQFIEDSLKRNIEHRQAEQTFVARAMNAREGAQNTGHYVTVKHTMARLRAIYKQHALNTPQAVQ